MEAVAELERMKVEKEFRRMQQQHKRENLSVQKLSNRKFVINTSFQIIARVKGAYTSSQEAKDESQFK